MPLSRRSFLQASSLLLARRAGADERFGFDFEREQATREGLALLVIVLSEEPGFRFREGVFWGDFFTHAAPSQLADLALVERTIATVATLNEDLPAAAEPLPPDTFLALYPPGEREPRLLRRSELPFTDATFQRADPWVEAKGPPLGLDHVLRRSIHPDAATIAARLEALESVLSRTERPLPTARLLRDGLRARLMAELTPWARHRLLDAIGRSFEKTLRHRPLDRVGWEWWRVPLPPSRIACPCGIGHTSRESRKFLRFYLGD